MAYFLLTLIYTWLITFMLPLFFELKYRAYLSLCIPIILFLCFVLMFGYGYVIIKSKHPRKPLSRLGLYAPMFLSLIWYLFNKGICNALNFNSDMAAELIGLWAGHLFGGTCVFYAYEENMQILGLDLWHSVLILDLIYGIILILGFAAGEYFAVKKTDVERKPFAYHKKVITIVLAVIISVYSLSEFALFKHRENIVETAHRSYGFRYEGGYSSIDLYPYYVENEENILAKPEEPATFTISNIRKMPVMDGAEAAYPVYSAFANACYDNISEIQENAKKSKSDAVMPIQFTNTIYAYEKLLSGDIDIFFGARPSEAQLKMAKEAGAELKLTPIGKEAFVFFVNEKNPVDNLSSEQLRDIYSGKINNWRKVGGENQKILAFQRPKNSGSQTMMEYFMGDTPLREPLQAESVSSMGDVVRGIADYENSDSSLGYSFRYYTTIMMADSGEEVTGIKLLAVDGVFPDTEMIQSGEYPYTTQLYAITVENRTDAKSTIEPFLEWMTGPQGQQIVSDTGYVALSSNKSE